MSRTYKRIFYARLPTRYIIYGTDVGHFRFRGLTETIALSYIHAYYAYAHVFIYYLCQTCTYTYTCLYIYIIYTWPVYLRHPVSMYFHLSPVKYTTEMPTDRVYWYYIFCKIVYTEWFTCSMLTSGICFYYNNTIIWNLILKYYRTYLKRRYF